MNLSFSLEKASSFSPVPGPAMLVVLEPAVEEEAVVGAGAAAASASLRLSFIVAMLGSQADAGNEEKKKEEAESVRFFFSFAAVTDACQRQRARLVRWLSWRRSCEQLLAQPE